MLFPRFVLPLCALASTSSAAHAPPAGLEELATPAPAAAPQLKGRFIHLTDVHPDPYYRPGASEDEACHFPAKKKHKKGKKHKGKKGKGKLIVDEPDAADEAGLDARAEGDDDEWEGGVARTDKARTAGHWGLPISDCDTPLAFVNATFDWLEEHFKDEVDFVVWTGDNARHDIDSRVPRSLPEIFDLNRYVRDRVRQAFGKDVPIVASIGNNDVYPHNVFFPGPNKVTNELLDIWKHLIPEQFLHTFARGGYYSVEAAGGDLLLVSLNTMYFYMRNTVVDGCPPFDEDLSLLSHPSSSAAHLNATHSPASPEAAALFAAHIAALTTARDLDPGTEQLLWLEQQLVLARARGMQVLLTGHVPATRANWYDGCFTRYAELVLGWQDTVVGQLFGHMNVDMFSFIQEADTSSALLPSASLSPPASHATNNRLLAPFSSSLVDGLHSLYTSLPSLKKLKERDYLPVHVNPSVIPTYLSGLRVWEYNTSREAREEMRERVRAEQDDDLEEDDEERGTLARLVDAVKRKGRRGGKGKKGKKRPQDPDRPPKPPRRSSPHAPARTNTYLSPLSYTQYFLPLSAYTAPGVANGSAPPQWQVEYTTLSASEAARRLIAGEGGQSDPVFPPETLPAPVRALLSSPRAHTPSALHALRRALKRAHLTPYDGVLSAAEGLTVRAWVRAARWVVGKEKGGEEGEWEAFRGRMGVGSGEL
ncbi:Endopolyphosphatase [Rhodotorula kratochvilovae]